MNDYLICSASFYAAFRKAVPGVTWEAEFARARRQLLRLLQGRA